MITNPAKFMAGFWNWDIFAGCFGTGRVKPTDIDGCVERNGQTLIIETKGIGVPVPMGQMIMFERWASLGCFTIVILWGTTDNPVEMMVLKPDGKIIRKQPTDLDGVRAFLAKWYAWADQQVM